MPISNRLNQILFDRAIAERELAAATDLDTGHLNLSLIHISEPTRPY